MRQRRLDRNLCLILPAGLLFVSAANSLFADSLTITGTATSSNIAGIAVGDQWTGTLTTNGTCLLYAPANGGLLGLSINMYGDLLSATDAEGYPKLSELRSHCRQPQFRRVRYVGRYHIGRRPYRHVQP